MPANFKNEFDRVAVGGVIGDPRGLPAYGYGRVSTDEQGEEGRAGLPRQIEHIHKQAAAAGYAITWDRMYLDDYTGFEFVHRPQLSILRRELQKQNRAGDAVVIESLDRLSRDADWHQGYLLHEMKERGVTVVFWEEIRSRVERMVRGAIAQDGMEQTKARMHDGIKRKAREGRITARKPAYGYRFVDSTGNESAAARRDTHYALKVPECEIVRYMFDLMLDKTPLRQVAEKLNTAGYRTPQGRYWDHNNVRVILVNPVYKGDFVANRKATVYEERSNPDGSTRRVTRRYDRPEEEWTHVPVPAIVSPAEWALVQQTLKQNKLTSSRNAKTPYLLTGLVKCACCGYTYLGFKNGSNRKTVFTGYVCSGRHSRPKEKRRPCDNPQISAEQLESAVWGVVVNDIIKPDRLIRALGRNTYATQNAELLQQLDYLSQEIASKQAEDEPLYRAFVAEVFDTREYKERRDALKAEIQRLTDQRREVEAKVIPAETIEGQKQMLRDLAERMKDLDPEQTPPFEVRKKVIQMMVGEIRLNVRDQWMELAGVIGGRFELSSGR